MVWSSRSRGEQVVAVLLLAVLIVASAATAAASRTVELVTTAPKHGNWAKSGTMSADGTRAFLQIWGGSAGSQSGSNSYQLAVRGSRRWDARAMMVDRAAYPGRTQAIAAISPDFTSFLFTVSRSMGVFPATDQSWLTRLRSDGGVDLLHTTPAESKLSSHLASDDLGVVLAHHIGGPPLLDRAVYEFGSGVPRLASVLPDGTPACGLKIITGSKSLNRLSADGRRLYFDASPDCGQDHFALYLRETGPDRDYSANGAETVRLDEVPPGEVDMGGRLVQVSRDGAVAIFRTASNLPGDSDGLPDLYRFTAHDRVRTCLTCNGSVPANVNTELASEDGSHVYFTTSGQLIPGAGAEGAQNLYLWTARNGIRYLGNSNGVSTTEQGETGPAATTPDGRTLVFRASVNVTGYDSEGTSQLYRYSEEAQTITCLSCASAGSPPTGASLPGVTVPGPLMAADRLRIVSDDGATVVFFADGPLVPEDVNRERDIYEWDRGVIRLISDGVTTGAGVQLYDVSASGDDVLFSAYARMTSDAVDDAGQAYNAHRGPGSLVPVTEGHTPCSLQTCQPVPAPGPHLPESGTGDVQSQGNSEDSVVAVTPQLRLIAVSRADRRRFARSGRLRLRVSVNAPGAVDAVATAKLRGARAQVIARSHKHVRRPGTVGLVLRLTTRARRRLANGRPLPVALRVGFTGATPRFSRMTLPGRSAGGRR